MTRRYIYNMAYTFFSILEEPEYAYERVLYLKRTFFSRESKENIFRVYLFTRIDVF